MKDENLSDFLSTGVSLKSRVIWFDTCGDEDDTSDATVDKFCKQLLYLEAQSSDPITIYMKNDGGEVGAGLAIHDMIKLSPCRVTIIGLNNVSSMGSIIMQAADERKMLTNTYMMIHEGEVSYQSNHPKSTERWVKLDKILAEVCYDIYLDRIREVQPKFTKKRLTKLLEHDTILSVEEAIELGLIDEVVTKR